MYSTAQNRPARAVATSATFALLSMAVVGTTLITAPAHASTGSAAAGHKVSQVAKKSATTVLRIGSHSYPLAGTNKARKAGKIVAYASPRRATPKAKKGVDVLIYKGRVRAVKVHSRHNKAGLGIPRGAWAVAGAGKSASWLRSVARVGSTVGTVRAAAAGHAAAYAGDGGTTSSSPMGLPSKVEAVYHMMWSNSGSPQLRNVPAGVNVVNLAFLQGDTPQLVGWGSQSQSSFIADARALRARGVRIVASVGGAGGYVNTGNRQGFVNGVMALNAILPLDGLDWDIESSSWNSADIVWISKRLKELRGSRFAITLAPNGSNIDSYLSTAVQLQRAGALDMIGQQFYDAVVSKEAALGRVQQAVAAGIPQSKYAVGMMVGSASTYWTVDECVAAVRYIKSHYPGIRGGYLWEASRPGTSDWASSLSSLIRG